jgi:hypothetical protein
LLGVRYSGLSALAQSLWLIRYPKLSGKNKKAAKSIGIKLCKEWGRKN